MPAGRFAPSPTGALHLGNLRTALVAWLAARSTGSRFVMRIEDLDPVRSSAEHEQRQLEDLAAIGLDWDGEVIRQSTRFGRHHQAIDQLTAAGLTYPCYCTRREIAEAVRAPQGASSELRYPGTCRSLTAEQRRAAESRGRPAALRLAAHGGVESFVDRLCGPTSGTVDDAVLRRNDGVPAYNLAVVVDDAEQGIAEVVRGDDLLGSTPTQIHLARLLGLAIPDHLHVPLVLGPDGRRLAKRDGAVTLADRRSLGESVADVVSRLAVSLGLAGRGETVSAHDLVTRFDVDLLPRSAWVLPEAELR